MAISRVFLHSYFEFCWAFCKVDANFRALWLKRLSKVTVTMVEPASRTVSWLYNLGESISKRFHLVLLLDAYQYSFAAHHSLSDDSDVYRSNNWKFEYNQPTWRSYRKARFDQSCPIFLTVLNPRAAIIVQNGPQNWTRAKKSPLIASYIPTFMLWTFSALVPVLVWYAGYLEKHWTYSSTHYNIMQKCYGFLLLMVLGLRWTLYYLCCLLAYFFRIQVPVRR